MSITCRKYGEILGKTITAFTLCNDNGLEVEILNYGGIITKLIYKGIDVVLGWDNLDEYINNVGSYGALIGRNANRIENAEFDIKGKHYKLVQNSGNHNIHSGPDGFSKRIWKAEIINEKEPSIKLILDSPDGDQGFPGNLHIEVTYSLDKDNSLRIRYEGLSDQDTIVNMTNHSYFNPNGHESGSIENCKLWIASDFYLPCAENKIPTGEIVIVDNTPFDFKEIKTIRENLLRDSEQLQMSGSYDHTFVINGSGFRKSALCVGDKTGVYIEMHTDCPGVQVFIPPMVFPGKAKNGAIYCEKNAICLESQAFPNSINTPSFPTVVVKAEEKYQTETVYKFGIFDCAKEELI